jgi:hypothetical protein
VHVALNIGMKKSLASVLGSCPLCPKRTPDAYLLLLTTSGCLLDLQDP